MSHLTSSVSYLTLLPDSHNGNISTQFGNPVDLCQQLEDAAHAAQRCGQPVLLAPDRVLEIALFLRLQRG